MYNSFSEFLEKKNEANMRKAIIAGTSGALLALGGCSGSDCPQEPKTKQVELSSSIAKREKAIEKYRIERKQKEIERKEEINRKKKEEKEDRERQLRRPLGSHGGSPNFGIGT